MPRMPRLLPLALVPLFCLAGIRASFAVGGSVAGHAGYTAGTPGGVSPANDVSSATDHNYGKTGNLAIGNSTATPQIHGASTDNVNTTTTPRSSTTSGKGYPRANTGGTNHTDKNLQGINPASDPGGRGF